MKKTTYAGLDYSGPGATCNRDSKTGIRYGVIPSRAVGQSWYDSSEPDYGEPHCPQCGNKVESNNYADAEKREDYTTLHHGEKYACDECKLLFDGQNAFPEEPCGHVLDDGEYKCNEDSSGDIWVFKSTYFTYAQFCSPCAPGACYLSNPLEDRLESNRAYCLGHDFFESHRAPYPVFSVKTAREIIAVEKKVPCPSCQGTGRDRIVRIARARGCTEDSLYQSIQDGHEPSIVDCRPAEVDCACFYCDGIGHVVEWAEEEVPA
jgi:ribosomal protein L37AE/L43A